MEHSRRSMFLARPSKTPPPPSYAVSPDGTFAYVTHFHDNTVSSYRIGANRARKLVGTPIATGDKPYSITVNPAGTIAYVVNFGSDNTPAYKVGAILGQLTPAPSLPFAAGDGPISVVVAEPSAHP